MESVDAAGLSIGDDAPPRIMGVLNVSEESPYDPSVFAEPAAAASYVDDRLIGEGADIVDVGLESANKRLDVLSPEDELERLETACETIERVSGDAVFSIETRYATVADAALSRGFDMVNDICGFADPELPAVCADHGAAVVKMASPPDLERPGAVEALEPTGADDHLGLTLAALERGGLTDETIVDPAFGTWSRGQTLADDREVFRHLAAVRALDRPVLVSINRKNFLGELVDRPTEERLPVSLGATALAVARGASVIRTHDVAATRDAARGAHALTAPWSVPVDGGRLVRVPAGETGRRYLAARGVPPEARRADTRVEITLDGAERSALLERAAGRLEATRTEGGVVLTGEAAEVRTVLEPASSGDDLAALLQ